ncbi:hypothetical protein [Thiohalocapsa sp.]|uniref:hypothetical protein n=1 Tax=Thiohalocapsa sp. TaxID=2497641 RepID=UPI0025DED40C|nr:hypothetical protein [Thiohalocapsa sp.]
MRRNLLLRIDRPGSEGKGMHNVPWCQLIGAGAKGDQCKHDQHQQHQNAKQQAPTQQRLVGAERRWIAH